MSWNLTTKMSNQFNLENMCRTCRSVGELKCLYDSYDTTSDTDICLAEMLMLCTPVEYYNDDELPKQICQDCIQEVVRSYNFALKCKESNEMWQECVNSIYKLKRQSFPNQEMKHEPDSNDTINTTETNPVKMINISTAESPLQSKCDVDVTSLNDFFEPQANEIKIEEEHSFEIADEMSFKVDTFENSIDKSKSTHELNTLQNGWLPVVVLNKLPNTNTDDTNARIGQKNKMQLAHRYQRAISSLNNIDVRRRDEKYDFRNRNLPKLSINYCETFESDDEINPNQSIIINKSKTVLIRCHICRRCFNSKTRLEKHLQLCSGTPLQCPKCPRLFHSKAVLKRHFKIHDGRTLFLCKVCKNPFSSQSNLIVHLRTHTGETALSCAVCKRNHVKTFYTKNGDFQCKVCQKRYNSDALLAKLRRKTAASESQYNCGKCAQTFHTLRTLILHSKQHSGDPLFACSTCNAQFAKITQFSAHVQTHLKGDLHKCAFCSYFSRQMSHVNRHMLRRHSKSNSSSSKSKPKLSRTKPIQTHITYKPYACNSCDKSFRQKAGLNYHLERCVNIIANK